MRLLKSEAIFTPTKRGHNVKKSLLRLHKFLALKSLRCWTLSPQRGLEVMIKQLTVEQILPKQSQTTGHEYVQT